MTSKIRAFPARPPQHPPRPTEPPSGGSAAPIPRMPQETILIARTFKIDADRDRQLERVAARLDTTTSTLLRTITLRALEDLERKPGKPLTDRAAALAHFVGGILLDCASDNRIDDVERTRIIQECVRLLNEIVNEKERAA